MLTFLLSAHKTKNEIFLAFLKFSHKKSDVVSRITFSQLYVQEDIAYEHCNDTNYNQLSRKVEESFAQT